MCVKLKRVVLFTAAFRRQLEMFYRCNVCDNANKFYFSSKLKFQLPEDALKTLSVFRRTVKKTGADWEGPQFNQKKKLNLLR